MKKTAAVAAKVSPFSAVFLKSMTVPNPGRSYFELFELPVSFDLDLEELAQRYRRLQTAVHPDKYANASALERRLSVQQSALINEAYQVLKNPLSRAKYMLELNGMDMSADTDTAMDPQFLMQQMEFRERLESVPSSADPITEAFALGETIESTIAAIIKELSGLFSQAAPDWHAARDWVRRFQFLNRLQSEVEELEERYG